MKDGEWDCLKVRQWWWLKTRPRWQRQKTEVEHKGSDLMTALHTTWFIKAGLGSPSRKRSDFCWDCYPRTQKPGPFDWWTACPLCWGFLWSASPVVTLPIYPPTINSPSIHLPSTVHPFPFIVHLLHSYAVHPLLFILHWLVTHYPSTVHSLSIHHLFTVHPDTFCCLSHFVKLFPVLQEECGPSLFRLGQK